MEVIVVWPDLVGPWPPSEPEGEASSSPGRCTASFSPGAGAWLET